jgi:hypothetical protein
MAKTHFFEAIPAKLRFKIFLSYHDLYKKTFQIIIFLITPFGAPLLQILGPPLTGGPGQIASFAHSPPLGGPDWQSKARNNVFYEQRTSKNLLLIKH